MSSHFYYHPRMLSYDFGPQHPLVPERLRRTMALLETFGIEAQDPGLGDKADVLRVHSEEYVRAIEGAMSLEPDELYRYGISIGDTPAFDGMYEAALAYTAGSARAARDVKEGAGLAFNLSGGLHHAQRDHGSGFCVFNDCAVALHILMERFGRVAYVDIDVHHGDGVQAIFYEDPDVLTCSIHEDGRSLYPGTGFCHETGARFSSLNVPLEAGTTGDVWIWAFRNGVLPPLRQFKPEAIVLQMGADSQSRDPLAHIRNTVQDWLSAVEEVRALSVPIVALGGGGYEITNVPRMWAAAVLTLMGRTVPNEVPEPFSSEWGMPKFFDPTQSESSGRESAEQIVKWLGGNFHPGM